MQLLHRGLWAVRHWGQGDLRVQVQERREGQSGWVDVLELVDDVTDRLLHAVELLRVLLVSSLKTSGAHSHVTGEESGGGASKIHLSFFHPLNELFNDSVPSERAQTRHTNLLKIDYKINIFRTANKTFCAYTCVYLPWIKIKNVFIDKSAKNTEGNQLKCGCSEITYRKSEFILVIGLIDLFHSLE